jgi:hypothetical protein
MVIHSINWIHDTSLALKCVETFEDSIISHEKTIRLLLNQTPNRQWHKVKYGQNVYGINIGHKQSIDKWQC